MKMATNARLNKAKGRNLQNLVLSYIRSLFPRFSDHFKSRTMGESGTDIEMSPTGKEVFPFSIECKYRTTMAIYKMFEQAEKEAAKDENTPLLVCRAARKKALVVLNIDDFFSIMRTWKALTCRGIPLVEDEEHENEVEFEFAQELLDQIKKEENE